MKRVQLVCAPPIIVVMRVSRRFIGDMANIAVLFFSEPRLVLCISQDIVRVQIEVFAAIANGVHRPPRENGEEILLAENLVHHHPQMMLLVVVDGNEDRPVPRQQLLEQLQARPHHAQPLLMALQVLAVDRTVLLQPSPHQRAVDVVVVAPPLVAGVVGRVDIDAFHPLGVARQQCLECLEVVAVDDQVVVRPGRIERAVVVGDQRAVGHRQVVRVDMLLALEFQRRHGAYPNSSGANRNRLVRGRRLPRTRAGRRRRTPGANRAGPGVRPRTVPWGW